MAARRMRIVWKAALVSAVALAVPALGLAAADALAQAVDVEVEPITCWWRTTAAGVRMGEPFTVVLTCAAIETVATRTAADHSRLDPAVVQLPPYEVLGGARGDDVRTAGRRLFQYSYSLRLISEDAFGQVVDVPSLTINYTVEQRAQTGELVRGREHAYAVPALPLQVLSLVPETARSIKEPPGVDFSAVSAREFRGDALRLAGGVLMGLGALVVLIMAVRALALGRAASGAAARTVLSDTAVVRGLVREIDRIGAESRGGWSPDLAGQLLAAARLTASMAMGRPIARRAAGAAATLDGQIRIGRALVSGSATGDHVRGAGGHAATRVMGLDEILDRLTAARYGRGGGLDDALLNDARATVGMAAARVASEHTWMARARATLRRTLADVTGRVWAR